MKYINRKTVIAFICGAVVLGFSGCETEGAQSNTQLVGSTENVPPVAVAKVIPSEVTIGDTVTADGSDSYDVDGTIVSYVWKIQDIVIGSGMTEDVSTDQLAAGTYTVTLVVTDNNGATATDSTQVTLLEPTTGPICLEHAGYGIITITRTDGNQSTWLDKNLGATRVAEDFNDTEAFGDLYQWGRPTDGHEKRTSTTTQVLADTIEPGHDQFIVSPFEGGDKSSAKTTFPASYATEKSSGMYRSDDNGDWVENEVDDNGSLRYAGWKSTTRVSPTQVCPCGYVVPSVEDYRLVDENLSKVAVKLKLTLAGWRDSDPEGTIWNGSFGPYWTRNVYKDDSSRQSLYYGFWKDSSDSEEVDGELGVVPERRYGLPVRCINPSTSVAMPEDFFPE